MQANLARMRAELENERAHRVTAERLLAERTRELQQYRRVGDQLRHLDDGPITSIGQIRPAFEGWPEPAVHMAQLAVHMVQLGSRKRAATNDPEAERTRDSELENRRIEIDRVTLENRKLKEEVERMRTIYNDY